jgi:uncharacterized protein YifE (UPF0438 family)
MLPRDHYLKQSFVDSARFPNGFEKGGLSDIQARLVRKNGMLISALCIDEVSDPTPEDLHILKVIANQSSPKNPVEQAWVKYLSVVKNLAAANPKGKSKAKAKPAPVAEAELVPEPIKPVEKNIEKPAEKAPATKPAAKTPAKKAEPAPIGVKAKPAAKKEKVEPVAAKVPVKAAAKKAEPVKEEAKKPDSKKTDTKKAEPKKAATKAEPPKAATKAAAKVEAKKPAAKKATKAK